MTAYESGVGYAANNTAVVRGSSPDGETTMAKEITFNEALQRAQKMSEKYVEKGAYQFFPMPEIVDEVQGGLAKNLVNHGRLYCP